jgi:hypothetical protein
MESQYHQFHLQLTSESNQMGGLDNVPSWDWKSFDWRLILWV